MKINKISFYFPLLTLSLSLPFSLFASEIKILIIKCRQVLYNLKIYSHKMSYTVIAIKVFFI